MANVLQLDASTDSALVEFDSGGTTYSETWITADVACDAAYLTGLLAQSLPQIVVAAIASSTGQQTLELWQNGGLAKWHWNGTPASYTPPSFAAMQFYRVELHSTAGTPQLTEVWVDGVSVGAITVAGTLSADIEFFDLRASGGWVGKVYVDTYKAGTTRGGTEIFSDDFEGTLSGWSFVSGADAVIIADPGITPAGETPAPVLEGRVLIAFDDGPLEPAPTWTRIDDTDNLVAGYDIQTGKQTELDRTDTGTGTVYLHDTLGLFDPLNTGSPYFGKIVGKQILFQLWNPVSEEWVEEWRGRILDYNYDIVGVLGADGKPIVANIQVECVDIFDYLGGYGLQPGVNGDTPPAGFEGVVVYEDTAGTVDDRIIQILTEVGIDSTRYVVFSGNVKVGQLLPGGGIGSTTYDPGDAALTALRDCADAEFPGLANIYVDRFGRFVFHGRRARFDPDDVAAGAAVGAWDFHRWKVGDGTAIAGDSDYAQIRVLGYTHGESDIVNSAISWPAGMADTDMPGQVFEDAVSIAAHGKHSLPPMGDLIISDAPTTMNTPKVECAKFAEFFVHYLKDPQTRVTSLMVKAIDPTDVRATATWDVLCKADISDIMRTTVGYPNGVGIDMDNYIEGYTKRVRPLNPTHDLVEVEFNLTPTSWAMDPDGILAAAS